MIAHRPRNRLPTWSQFSAWRTLVIRRYEETEMRTRGCGVDSCLCGIHGFFAATPQHHARSSSSLARYSNETASKSMPKSRHHRRAPGNQLGLGTLMFAEADQFDGHCFVGLLKMPLT